MKIYKKQPLQFSEMRKVILIIAIALLTINAVARKNMQKSPADQLIERLQQLRKYGIMFGHQDALFYGTTWKWEYGRSDVNDVCGDYPAVLGCELGGLELGNEKNLDGVPFAKMRQQIIEHYKKGGIITISWHPYNPVTGQNAWNTEGNAVTAVLPGGKENVKMKLWHKRLVFFFKSLKDNKGNSIPVIFRPWHEMSGSWFWWGYQQCTPEQYKALYQLTYNIMRQAGLSNIVWSYSPNAQADDTAEHYFRFYPGDKYVDVLGVDLYQNNGRQDFINQCQNEMQIMSAYAKSHNKLYALTEAGYRNTPDEKWYTSTLLPGIKGFKPCYVLLWRNAWDNTEENFGPAPEKACAKDFKDIYKQGAFLFRSHLEKYTEKRKCNSHKN